MGLNTALSSWLRGAQSSATAALRAAQGYGATLRQQTMTAVSVAQRAATQPIQQALQPRSATPTSSHTTRTLTPVDAVARTVQGGVRGVQEATRQIVRAHAPIVQGVQRDVSRAARSAPAAVRSAPAAVQQAARQISAAHAPIVQGVRRDAGRAIQSAPAAVRSAPAAVQEASRQISRAHAPIVSSPAARQVAGAVTRGIQSTPMGFPVVAARAASGAVRVGQDALGFSSAVDRYKGREAALQKTYAAQKPLYDQYTKGVQNYEKGAKTYEKVASQYDQRLQAYKANPTRTGLAEVRMLEANLRMLGTPLQAQYDRLQAQDRALSPLWAQASGVAAERKKVESLQAQDRGVVSSAVIDALGAARMGTTPPASRQASTRSEQALLYGVYPAAVGAAEKWRSGVAEPFEREATKLTGGRPLVIPQGAIDAVRHPVARGAITALAPGMASTPLAMDIVTGAKQWAGAEPGINVTRFAAGVVRSPADAAEMIGMAIPGAEVAARRVAERPSDLLYLPIAGMAYMGAGTVEAFKQDPEGTAGSLVGMAALSRGVGRVSSAPLGRVAKTVRPRITEARISARINPVDRPAFHAVSTIGRGIEGIRSDVLMDPRFGDVLNVGAERAPILTNILADTPHSVYGSATRTGQMRPGSVMRQAKDVDIFVPDVDLLNTRIAQEFGRPYSVEGSTVVRQVPGQGTVHAIDTHAVPEGYPLPGAGRGVRVQYEEAQVAPELPFEWMPKDLLKAGRITQEYLHTQVQRKAASVAGEPVEGGGWRFGPPEHRATKDTFDLISDAEYLISAEEARLPGMNPVRRALVSRRLKRLRKAVEDLKTNPTLSQAYRTELQKAKKSVEEVAAPEDDILLRVSSMPAPRQRSPTIGDPSPLVIPGVSSLLSADPAWVANISRPPSPVRGASPRTSGAMMSPARSPARRTAHRPSRSPSVLSPGRVSPLLAGGASPSLQTGIVASSSPTTGRPAETSRTPKVGLGSASPGSPVVLAPSPYLYEPGPGTAIPHKR
ncbi:hypothetical protein [Methanoculleus sp. UBA303]|uniref:hypothetical protein n=1 Tax=Methanoculleus sp. UBA303 TaxID=1915497 RepID=UPI0025DBEA3D|nr:hypothetical protein [Methanoculleus sp. UBA303]